MRNFSISIDIDAPPQRVWEVMTDVERWHEWTESITSVAIDGGGPLRTGSRAVVRQPKFPPAKWTVIDFQPGRSFTWFARGPGFRTTGTHEVEPAGSGSRATLSLELRGLFGGIFGRMTREITERYIGYEARGLKARSENPEYRRS